MVSAAAGLHLDDIAHVLFIQAILNEIKDEWEIVTNPDVSAKRASVRYSQ